MDLIIDMQKSVVLALRIIMRHMILKFCRSMLDAIISEASDGQVKYVSLGKMLRPNVEKLCNVSEVFMEKIWQR